MDDSDCAICLSPPQGTIVTTPCGHTFCFDHLNEWLYGNIDSKTPIHRTCPLCRFTIIKEQLNNRRRFFAETFHVLPTIAGGIWFESRTVRYEDREWVQEWEGRVIDPENGSQYLQFQMVANINHPIFGQDYSSFDWLTGLHRIRNFFHHGGWRNGNNLPTGYVDDQNMITVVIFDMPGFNGGVENGTFNFNDDSLRELNLI